MIGLFLLGLVAVSTVIAVVVTMLALEGDDPVTTSTSSTAVTGTAGTAISTGTTSQPISSPSPRVTEGVRTGGGEDEERGDLRNLYEY
jgi:hypothetical protein